MTKPAKKPDLTRVAAKPVRLRGTCWRCGKSTKLPGHDKCEPKND